MGFYLSVGEGCHLFVVEVSICWWPMLSSRTGHIFWDCQLVVRLSQTWLYRFTNKHLKADCFLWAGSRICAWAAALVVTSAVVKGLWFFPNNFLLISYSENSVWVSWNSGWHCCYQSYIRSFWPQSHCFAWLRTFSLILFLEYCCSL